VNISFPNYTYARHAEAVENLIFMAKFECYPGKVALVFDVDEWNGWVKKENDEFIRELFRS
jgi:hypothetical protein